MPGIVLSNASQDICWVRALMLFPNKDIERERCFCVEMARFNLLECKDTDRLEIDARSLRLLIEAPAYDALKDITAVNTKRATVAGDILAMLYLMDRFGVPEPSLNKAIFAAMEFAKTAKYGDGTRMNVSERMVLECWNEYKPVAHLWGAFRINKAYPFAPDINIFSQEHFAPFLQVAVGLYNFGTQFIPFRAKHKTPVLEAEKCWKLPDSIPPSNLISDRMPDRLLKYLKKYKAPQSIV